MITQIEIDGFKTFKDFKVELAPFQVIVGANGSGKSNLFDALHLLGRLAEYDIRTAFQQLRGSPDELFTNFPVGGRANQISIAVEMFVNPTVKDYLGREETLRFRRLRYEINIKRGEKINDQDSLEIVFESLSSIPRSDDAWYSASISALSENNQPHLNPSAAEWFISTVEGALSSDEQKSEPATAILHQDGRGATTSLGKFLQGTVLRGVSGIEYPHVFAAREELRSLQFFHVNPTLLRQPSSTKAPQFLASDGEYLAATLARMQAEDEFALADVSRDMANLVPGISRVWAERDKLGDRYVIYTEVDDKKVFSSHVLSDGTLRLLALATLRNDSHLHGILCLEEPENGVSPLHLAGMARLLRSMATNLHDEKQQNESLRQVLVTTHSPFFISQPEVLDALLVAIVPTRIQQASSTRVTIMIPVVTPMTLSRLENIGKDEKAIATYISNNLQSYLSDATLAEARKQIEEGHSKLNER